MFTTTVTLAFSALLRNKLRSSLTMLGIVIGVAAVVMMQSMGHGATAYVGEAISGLGSNMLIVIPGAVRGMQHSELGAPLFTADDLGQMDAVLSEQWLSGSTARPIYDVASVALARADERDLAARLGLSDVATLDGSRDVLVLFSDGLKAGLDLSQETTLTVEHPIVIAHQLLQRFGRDSDDALVLVAR